MVARMSTSGLDNRADTIRSHFQSLHHALIDTSSIIYMNKAGYFDPLASCLELYAPAQVIKEVGLVDLNIRTIGEKEDSLPADQALVQAACRLNWPVVTEDRQIIRQLARFQLLYFNALMMLELIFFRGSVDETGYRKCLETLLRHAWYGSEIIRFGETVHQMLIREG